MEHWSPTTGFALLLCNCDNELANGEIIQWKLLPRLRCHYKYPEKSKFIEREMKLRNQGSYRKPL